MFKEKLNRIIKAHNSLLCVGLDCDLGKIPKFLLRETDPLLTFNREIIQAISGIPAAYKPNIAFYETLGIDGWRLLERTLELIPSDCLVIADAKRGDIGNTSRKYAELFFKIFNFDAITVSPYMGFDSIAAFLDFEDKGTLVLCLTSNKGALDFQYLNTDNEPLYIHVANRVNNWNLKYGNCGLVVGATHPEDLSSIREIAPSLPFLIPGIGAQGGDLRSTIEYGTDDNANNALINASRSILYASMERDFASAARESALELSNEINKLRTKKINKTL
jgi:orotidine-5'-phosphate decarboxylase